MPYPDGANSVLPQRLKKLVKYGKLVNIRAERKVIYIVPEWEMMSEAPPPETFEYDPEVMNRVNNALHDDRQSLETIARRAGIKPHIARRYLEMLIEQGVVREIEEGVYTVF